MYFALKYIILQKLSSTQQQTHYSVTINDLHVITEWGIYLILGAFPSQEALKERCVYSQNYGGPQLSQQNQKPHGKNKIPHDQTKNLTAKPKTSRPNQKPHGKTKNLTVKPKTSWQNQILHSKNQLPHGKSKYPWQHHSYFVFAVKYLVLP